MLFLRRNILNFHHRPFGLDISDLSLKVAWIERQGRYDQVRSFGSMNLPQGVIVDGEIIRPDVVIQTLREFLDKNANPRRISVRNVVCSIPEMKAFLRIIFMPRMERDEMQSAIQWELEGNIPMPLDQIYYDFQVLEDNMIVSPDSKKVAVLVVAVARHVVDQFIEVIEKVGLNVVGLETESVAQARVLIPGSEQPPKTSLIVDIGDRRTSFLIAVGNVPIFTSSSSLSSQMITDSISKTLRVSYEEADRMKIKYGIASPGQAQELFNASRPVLESLAVEIERSADFYFNSLHYTSSVDRVILCGGGSNLQGLVPFMARRLQKQVEMGDPWVNFSFEKRLPPIPYGDAVRYSTVLGLSFGEVS